MLTMLGVPAPAALAGTMLLRMLSLWLPLLPGVWLMRGAVVRRRRAATWLCGLLRPAARPSR